jgi:endonuclease G, mitochondrial
MRPLYLLASTALWLMLTATVSQATEKFSACTQFFANGKPPIVAPRPTDRALCYDAFAILHSGESKSAVFVAEKLNRASFMSHISGQGITFERPEQRPL